mmetsp:Transcript_31666/g.100958  ORF Transcript_31666/g.100958 Transcript_31666/m.100958 type:complete len:636 (-) Transcript_31666:63-1970(-)|eukprot:CAMPEP_0182887636 /NCGR_PEP_ID=MMETSP0034_2-20130328/20949_1 /TAXON_ID=156128 /ORGANISM="Nephroselmis pyriformis, Strain CCMP717" /LENGTH=635 /DNA_ID=CAMNT_0025021013 /DNA_START=23 /DNA_END=1930 /DNA_ORIENTATION=-
MGCASSSEANGQAAAGLSSANSTNRQHAQAEAAAAASLLGGGFGCSLVEISLEAMSLPNKDVMSKSDPMAVLFLLEGNTWKEIGRTEVLSDTLNPKWVRSIRTTYNFDRVQKVRVVVVDADSHHAEHNKVDIRANADHLGQCELTLAELLSSSSRRVERRLEGVSGRPGAVAVYAEEVANQHSLARLTFAARGLENTDTFGKSDPFLRVDRLREDGSRQPVFKTEVVMNNLSPAWKPIELGMSQLCNGDPYRPLVLGVFDWDSDGSHDPIGEAQTSFNDLRQLADAGGVLTLQAPKGSRNPDKPRGELVIKGAETIERPSFLDYISGGCEISFMVGVDFTASNGNPEDPSSLHHRGFGDPPRPNQYEQAVMGLGNVLEFYDTDHKYPTWGFGGRFQGNPTSHCFALNGNNFAPEVQGVAGILAAYRQALQHMSLAGPTLFAPIINAAAQVAAGTVGGSRQSYHVLVMLTDGIITDMQETIRAVVNASGLPLSILIIGVQSPGGGTNFSAMEALDGDNRRLTVPGGKAAERDIVQFVPFTPALTREALAAELLAEVPKQLLDYFMQRNIRPMARMGANPAPVHAAASPGGAAPMHASAAGGAMPVHYPPSGGGQPPPMHGAPGASSGGGGGPLHYA